MVYLLLDCWQKNATFLVGCLMNTGVCIWKCGAKYTFLLSKSICICGQSRNTKQRWNIPSVLSVVAHAVFLLISVYAGWKIKEQHPVSLQPVYLTTNLIRLLAIVTPHVQTSLLWRIQGFAVRLTLNHIQSNTTAFSNRKQRLHCPVFNSRFPQRFQNNDTFFLIWLICACHIRMFFSFQQHAGQVCLPTWHPQTKQIWGG